MPTSLYCSCHMSINSSAFWIHPSVDPSDRCESASGFMPEARTMFIIKTIPKASARSLTMRHREDSGEHQPESTTHSVGVVHLVSPCLDSCGVQMRHPKSSKYPWLFGILGGFFSRIQSSFHHGEDDGKDNTSLDRQRSLNESNCSIQLLFPCFLSSHKCIPPNI